MPHTDWNKCVVRQEDTDEMLKGPSNSALGLDRARFKTIVKHTVAFQQDQLSAKYSNAVTTGSDSGHRGSILAFKAKRHDSRRLPYNKTKHQRTQKSETPTKIIQ